MELSHCLADRGFKITFVNSDFNHKRVVAAFAESGIDQGARIHLVSIPDGLEVENDRKDICRLNESVLNIIPGHLEELIGKINESDDDKITCIVADVHMGWAFNIAEKLGIKKAAFWPSEATICALTLHIPKLIADGVIDEDGVSTKQEMIKLTPTMPAMNTTHFIWQCMGDMGGLDAQKSMFNLLVKINQFVKNVDKVFCNSSYEIERPAFEMVPRMQPIGPLLSGSHHGQPVGNFWPDDSSSLSWLDQYPNKSVIYVAFGSNTMFDKSQFHELALGLELSGQPFLWVVRPDVISKLDSAYPDGFLARIADRGRIVGWSAQQRVLAHPSVACFFSHCGWNSTTDGLLNGTPFLCWPNFYDQFPIRSYIIEVWRVGLALNPDSNGSILRTEIKNKLHELLSDETIRSRASELKEMTRRSISEGGSSWKSFSDLVSVITVNE